MAAENFRLLVFQDKGDNEVCVLLLYYAATFRDNLSVPSSSDNKFLTLEEGTDSSSRNVGNKLPPNAA